MIAARGDFDPDAIFRACQLMSCGYTAEHETQGKFTPMGGARCGLMRVADRKRMDPLRMFRTIKRQNIRGDLGFWRSTPGRLR
jgi:hypothetical protein